MKYGVNWRAIWADVLELGLLPLGFLALCSLAGPLLSQIFGVL